MGNCCANKSVIPATRTIYPSSTVHFDEYGRPSNLNAQFASNLIRTTKYRIWSFLPLNLWEQLHRFANVYFIFILILNFIPGIDAFAKEVAPIPVLLALSLVAIKDAVEDFRRHLSDRRVNRRICKVYCPEQERYMDEKWQNILPGDFVRLHTNEMIPADVLLLHSSNVAGICHIETANLDGESNLKQREVLDRSISKPDFSPSRYTYPAEVESPSSELYKFNGKIVRPDGIIPIRKNNMILRGCVLRNTDHIEGMVIYAGPETKANMNNTGPRFKRSKLERRINLDVIWCVLILIIICVTGAIGSGVWQQNLPGNDVLFVVLDRNATTSSPAFQGFLNFWRFIILFQSIIPLPLYMSIEFIKMHQVWHMNQDLELYDPRVNRRVEVRAFNILEDLGQIEYVFCDKTGTLTDNKMEFKQASIDGQIYATSTTSGCNDHNGRDKPSRNENPTAYDHMEDDAFQSTADVRLFDTLKPLVQRMSLIHPTRKQSASLSTPLTPRFELPPVEQPLMEQSHIPSGDAIARATSSAGKQRDPLVEDFILALTICNTAVVSVTKNTASLFQVPTRRKGLKHLLRSTPNWSMSKRKKFRKPSSDNNTSVKHAVSLSSLFSRRTQPQNPHHQLHQQLKTDMTSVARFETHSEEMEDANEQQNTTDTTLTTPTPQTPRVVTNRFIHRDPATTPQIVLFGDDGTGERDLTDNGAPLTDTGLPLMVQGLTLDLPTPRSLNKSPGLVGVNNMRVVDALWQPTKTNKNDCSSDPDSNQPIDDQDPLPIENARPATVPNLELLAVPSQQEADEVGCEVPEYASDDLLHHAPSVRTLTVVAYDGSSYELPVSEDYVHEANASGTCPLSDSVLYESYETESPDELSLVRTACRQGCKLLQRGLDFVLIWLPTDGLVGVRVLHILPFDSLRKRMSILIRHPATDEIILYTKGADSAILDRIKCTSREDIDRLSATRGQIDEVASSGLRTLVIAKRVIGEDELKAWSREYVIAETNSDESSRVMQTLMDRIERDFTLIGATAIEDRLQAGVPETIEHLREAGMHVWVLTGDKQETAVNVAHSAKLLTEEHRLICINASSKLRTNYLINCHLHSIVCGQPWSESDPVTEVVSDGPDLDSLSSSPSSSATHSILSSGSASSIRSVFSGSRVLRNDQSHQLDPSLNTDASYNGPLKLQQQSQATSTPFESYTNPRHVRVHLPGGDRSPRPIDRIRPNRVPFLRSVSETRTPYKSRRRRLRPRPRVRRLARRRQRACSVLPRLSQVRAPGKLALVIDGETLQFALEEDVKMGFLRLARLCNSVLCCRSTPSQKAAVVKLVKEGLGVQTLAIGDGANDVNMIQVADVGVGIGGEEGMQAVMASDFAISRFRFLERLILYHGHVCYDKLAHSALYLFYKDAVYIFLLFWFQLFNGFSGSNGIDQLSQILFPVTFTSLPPFLMGIWDNPVDAATLMANPVLYRVGSEGRSYRPWLFWVNILDAMWQSLFIFFIPYLFYADSSMTLWRFGLLQMNILVLTSLAHAALETRTWVSLHVISLLFSYLVCWIVFTMIYHTLAVTGISPECPYQVIFVAMHDGPFWLLTLLTIIIALLPRLLLIALKNTINPSMDTVATLMARLYGRGQRLPLEAYFGFPIFRRSSATHAAGFPSDSASLAPDANTPTHGLARATSIASASLPSSHASLPQLEHVEPIDKPTHFMTRVEQLLSVGGRLFRGAAHDQLPVTAPISPTSMVNIPRPLIQFPTDSRLRRRRVRTVSYGSRPTWRHRPTSILDSPYLGRVSNNNFDDEAGQPTTPVIWPAADPRNRAYTLSLSRNRRARPFVSGDTFHDLQPAIYPMSSSPMDQKVDPSVNQSPVIPHPAMRNENSTSPSHEPPPYTFDTTTNDASSVEE